MSIKNITENLNRIQLNSSPQPRHTEHFGEYKKTVQQGNTSDEDTLLNVVNKKREMMYRSIPLPSDDEDSDDDRLIQKRSFVKPTKTTYQRTLRQTRSDGSTYSTFNKRPMTRSAEDLSRRSSRTEDDEIIGYSRHRPQQPARKQYMSGMELLLLREQEKAGSRRQKPKLIPSKVKIEGLLSKLPESGTHNISFQQMQLEHKCNKRLPKLTPPSYPPLYNPHAIIAPNNYYQLPTIPISNGSLYMTRPPSASRNHHRQSSGHSIPFL